MFRHLFGCCAKFATAGIVTAGTSILDDKIPHSSAIHNICYCGFFMYSSRFPRLLFGAFRGGYPFVNRPSIIASEIMSLAMTWGLFDHKLSSQLGRDNPTAELGDILIRGVVLLGLLSFSIARYRFYSRELMDRLKKH